jgi:hypothetical protein
MYACGNWDGSKLTLYKVPEFVHKTQLKTYKIYLVLPVLNMVEYTDINYKSGEHSKLQ